MHEILQRGLIRRFDGIGAGRLARPASSARLMAWDRPITPPRRRQVYFATALAYARVTLRRQRRPVYTIRLAVFAGDDCWGHRAFHFARASLRFAPRQADSAGHFRNAVALGHGSRLMLGARGARFAPMYALPVVGYFQPSISLSSRKLFYFQPRRAVASAAISAQAGMPGGGLRDVAAGRCLDCRVGAFTDDDAASPPRAFGR